jgi:hypothetical protein
VTVSSFVNCHTFFLIKKNIFHFRKYATDRAREMAAAAALPQNNLIFSFHLITVIVKDTPILTSRFK